MATKSQGKFTMAQVAEHDKRTDNWIIISGSVYDVSKWGKDHPGGELVLAGMAGQDASTPFISFHDLKKAKPFMRAFKIGECTDYKRTQLSIDYEVLRDKVKEEGLYETDYGFYRTNILWYTFLFASVWGLVLYRTTFSILLGGIVLGLFWQQVAFTGHDVGHNAVTHVRTQDWWYGIYVTLFFGVSGQWWKRSHNVHHIFPNSMEWDPDIQHMPFLAIDSRILKGLYSFYHEKQFHFDFLASMLVRWQHILFVPIMGFARYFMYVESWVLMLNFKTTVYYRFYETCALAGYWVWLVCLLSFVPTWSLRAGVMLLSHMFCGILHMQITLNHFAMPVNTGTGYTEGESDHFIKSQLETTCDIGCDPSVDWFHGGLQFQTVHHLFPRLPRHNLRYVKEKYMVPFCKEHGLNYITTSGFFATLWIVLKKMYEQAMFVRDGKIVNFTDSLLAQAVEHSMDG